MPPKTKVPPLTPSISPQKTTTSPLDFKLFGRFSLEQCFYIGIFLLALILRLWDVGTKTLHHDESLHAVYSKYFYDGIRSYGENLFKGFRGEMPIFQAITSYFGSDRGQGLNYYFDPMMHGPLLFILTGFSYLFAGLFDYFIKLPLAYLLSSLLILFGSCSIPFLLKKKNSNFPKKTVWSLILLGNFILFSLLILTQTGYSQDKLAGVNDFTSRLVPALLGVIFVVSPFFFRRFLGRLGAIICSLGFLISPTIMYVSRFQRHDIYLELATVGMVLGIFQYMRTEQRHWFYVFMLSLSAGWALLEVNYITLFIFVLFFVFFICAELIAMFIWKAPKAKQSFIAFLSSKFKYFSKGPLFLILHSIVGWILLFAVMNFSLPNAKVPGFISNAFSGKIPLLGNQQFQVSFSLGALFIPLLLAILLALAIGAVIVFFAYVLQEKELYASAVVLRKLAGILGNVEILYTGILLFFIPIIILFTTFFSNPVGFLQAIPIPWETKTSLGYWLAQQHVQRGDQLWNYYVLLMAPYEILFVLFGMITMGITAFKLGVKRQKEGVVFLVTLFVSYLAFGTENFIRSARYAAEKAQGILEKQSLLDVRSGTNYGLLEIFLWAFIIFAGFYALGFYKSKLEKKKQNALITHKDLPHFEELFVITWFVLMFMILSWAGEKMPWLNMHLASPMVFMACFSLRDITRRLWRSINKSYFASILVLSSSAYLVYLAMHPALLITPLFWFLPIAILLAGIILIFTQVSSKKYALNLALFMCVLGVFGSYTTVSALRLSYELPDDPAEPLVYTQSSYDVKDIADKIRKASKGLQNPAQDMNITIESTQTWPFVWYLQDFPNIGYPATVTSLNNEEIVLISKDTKNDPQQSTLMQKLNQEYVGEEYTLRWWWIPDKTLWQYTYDVPGQTEKKTATNNFAFWTSPELWNWILTREVWTNKQYPQTKGTYDGVFYVRKDLASLVWEDGAPIGQKPSETTTEKPATDTYATKKVAAAPLFSIGTYGQGNGQFFEPKGVAITSQGIYVLDRSNNRIQHFSNDGTFISTFGSFGDIKEGTVTPGQFSSPGALATDAQENIYVTDMWNHRIQVFSPTGAFLRTFGVPGQNAQAAEFWAPRGISIWQNEIYITDTGNKMVKVFDLQGTFLRSWGGGGMDNGKFNEPVGILAGKDAVYVADTWNHRIQKFGKDGTFVTQWPIDGWGEQHNHNEPYLAFAKDGSILATDPPNSRVLKFSTNGDFLGMIGSAGTEAGQFSKPTGIAVDKSGNIFIVDTLNNRVQKVKGF